MDDYIKFITSQEFIGIFTIALSIFLGFFFYYKNQRMKILYYDKFTLTVISSSINSEIKDIEILIKGKKVNSISITKLVAWNAGNETIRREDITDINPVRIILENDLTLFNYDVIKISSDEECVLDFQLMGSEILLNIKYWEPNSGFILKLIHPSTSVVKVFGKIIGGKNVKRYQALRREYMKFNFLNKKINLFDLQNANKLMTLFIAILSLLVFIKGIRELAVGMIIFSTLLFVTSTIFLIGYSKTKRLPKELEDEF